MGPLGTLVCSFKSSPGFLTFKFSHHPEENIFLKNPFCKKKKIFCVTHGFWGKWDPGKVGPTGSLAVTVSLLGCVRKWVSKSTVLLCFQGQSNEKTTNLGKRIEPPAALGKVEEFSFTTFSFILMSRPPWSLYKIANYMRNNKLNHKTNNSL